MQPYKGCGINTANKHKLDVQGVIRLKVILGDLRVNICLGASRTVAKRVILGTPFYYRFIGGCFPNEKKIFLKDSRPVPILTDDPDSSLANAIDDYERLSTSDSESSSSDERQKETEEQEMLLASTYLASLQVGDDPTVRVARAQWLDPWTQTPVLCTSNSVGLILISAEGGVLTKRTLIAATGVHNLPPDQPF